MKTYYIKDEIGNILIKDTELDRLRNSLLFIPKLQGKEILETEEEIVYINNKYKFKKDAAEEITQKEQEIINHLTMTALDFVTYIKKAGVPDEIILQYLQTNPSVQLQLTLCQNVYCGVVRRLCPIKITEELILTDEQVVNMFKDKNKIV